MANELRGGLIIREGRADGLTHKICEERVDGLTLKIDGVRVQGLIHNISEERADGLTHKSSEERADGLTQRLVDDDGSESGGYRWTNTSTTSCLRRTQRKFEPSSALDRVRCEKTWLRMAQVTPSTEFALRKWVELLNWVVTQSGVCSSFVEIENEVHDEECWRGWSDGGLVASSGGVDGVDGGGFDGFDGVEWWLRWRRWWFGGLVASMASMVGIDGGLGSSTQRALTWKSLCVPSGEDGTHSSSLFFV